MDASMIHPQKLIPIDFHLRKKHAKKKYPERFFSHQRETLVGERGRSESLEKNGFPPLAALCETDRYLVPLIGWINGPGCGVTGVQVARREMDGTREKKRRFSTWGKDHGRGMKRSSNASSIPTDNATDIENGFCVARYIYVNLPGVL